MGDEPNTPPADPQAGKTGDPQPQAGNNTTPEPQAGEGQDFLTGQISLEEAKKLRSESANLRKRLKEFEALNTELKTFKERIETEKLSDDEKREAARTKLEQQLSEHQNSNSNLLRELQEQRVTNEVYRQASRLNIIDLDAAARLIDSSKIDYDDSGNPTNIDDLLKDMIKQRSWLVGKAPTQTSGGATNPSRSQTGTPVELTEEYVKSLMNNPEEFRKLTPEQQQRISAWIGKNYVRYR